MHWKNNPKGQGILIAIDEKVEWLLPWWWKRYIFANDLPIAVVDLGMSHYGKIFCQERAQVFSLHIHPFLSDKVSLPENWNKIFGSDLWEKRKSWFKKPFALLATPFEKTLWLDVDCEIIKPLDRLFSFDKEICLARETENSIRRERSLKTIFSDEILYNSGVILYSHGAKVIELWAEAVLKQKDQFWSDQHALSRVIYSENFFVEELHENYNWRMSQGFNIHAAIIHWAGSWGKEYIRRYGGLADELHVLPQI